MKLPSYLHLSRHHVFRFRRRVPDDLRTRIQRDELRVSLRTRDKAAAIRAARVLALKTDLLFDELRSMTDKKRRSEELRVDLNYKLDLSDLGLGKHELDWDASDPAESEEAAKHIARLEELAKAAQHVQQPIRIEQQAPSIVTLSDLVREFFSDEELARRNNKRATVRKDRDALNLFMEVTGGHRAMRDITQVDAVRFSRALAQRGGASNTKNNYMSSIGKFSSWVVGWHSETEHRKLEFEELRFKTEKRPDEERDAFTVAEVRTILLHPDMEKFKLREPHKYWLPWIAAHSGLRLEEIAQLDPRHDIRTDDAGILVFDVNDRDGKQLKNGPSRRLVPVHVALEHRGLLDYVEELRRAGATRLFPDTPAFEGRVGKNAGKTVNRFIQRHAGIEKSMHSFRHTIATILKRALVEESVAAALLGHAHGNITYGRYGKNHLTEVLRDVAFPHIDFRLDSPSEIAPEAVKAG